MMQRRKNKEDPTMPRIQNGAAAGLPQRNPKGTDKRATMSKQLEPPKSSPKQQQQRDMRLFAQKTPKFSWENSRELTGMSP